MRYNYILKRNEQKNWQITQLDNDTLEEKVLKDNIIKYNEAYNYFMNLCLKNNIMKIETYATHLEGN